MNKYLIRIAAFLLIPCLIADPVTASGLHALSAIHSPIRATRAPSIFEDQALISRLLGAWTSPANRPEAVWVRNHAAAQTWPTAWLWRNTLGRKTKDSLVEGTFTALVEWMFRVAVFFGLIYLNGGNTSSWSLRVILFTTAPAIVLMHAFHDASTQNSGRILFLLSGLWVIDMLTSYTYISAGWTAVMPILLGLTIHAIYDMLLFDQRDAPVVQNKKLKPLDSFNKRYQSFLDAATVEVNLHTFAKARQKLNNAESVLKEARTALQQGTLDATAETLDLWAAEIQNRREKIQTEETRQVTFRPESEPPSISKTPKLTATAAAPSPSRADRTRDRKSLAAAQHQRSEKQQLDEEFQEALASKRDREQVELAAKALRERALRVMSMVHTDDREIIADLFAEGLRPVTLLNQIEQALQGYDSKYVLTPEQSATFANKFFMEPDIPDSELPGVLRVALADSILASILPRTFPKIRAAIAGHFGSTPRPFSALTGLSQTLKQFEFFLNVPVIAKALESSSISDDDLPQKLCERLTLAGIQSAFPTILDVSLQDTLMRAFSPGRYPISLLGKFKKSLKGYPNLVIPEDASTEIAQLFEARMPSQDLLQKVQTRMVLEAAHLILLMLVDADQKAIAAHIEQGKRPLWVLGRIQKETAIFRKLRLLPPQSAIIRDLIMSDETLDFQLPGAVSRALSAGLSHEMAQDLISEIIQDFHAGSISLLAAVLGIMDVLRVVLGGIHLPQIHQMLEIFERVPGHDLDPLIDWLRIGTHVNGKSEEGPRIYAIPEVLANLPDTLTKNLQYLSGYFIRREQTSALPTSPIEAVPAPITPEAASLDQLIAQEAGLHARILSYDRALLRTTVSSQRAFIYDQISKTHEELDRVSAALLEKGGRPRPIPVARPISRPEPATVIMAAPPVTPPEIVTPVVMDTPVQKPAVPLSQTDRLVNSIRTALLSDRAIPFEHQTYGKGNFVQLLKDGDKPLVFAQFADGSEKRLDLRIALSFTVPGSINFKEAQKMPLEKRAAVKKAVKTSPGKKKKMKSAEKPAVENPTEPPPADAVSQEALPPATREWVKSIQKVTQDGIRILSSSKMPLSADTSADLLRIRKDVLAIASKGRLLKSPSTSAISPHLHTIARNLESVDAPSSDLLKRQLMTVRAHFAAVQDKVNKLLPAATPAGMKGWILTSTPPTDPVRRAWTGLKAARKSLALAEELQRQGMTPQGISLDADQAENTVREAKNRARLAESAMRKAVREIVPAYEQPDFNPVLKMLLRTLRNGTFPQTPEEMLAHEDVADNLAEWLDDHRGGVLDLKTLTLIAYDAVAEAALTDIHQAIVLAMWNFLKQTDTILANETDVLRAKFVDKNRPDLLMNADGLGQVTHERINGRTEGIAGRKMLASA